MCQPNVQGITADSIPVIREDEGRILTRLIAGRLYGQKGAADTQTPITVAHVRMEAGSETTLPLPAHYNAFYYIIEGEFLTENDELAGPRDLVVFHNDGNELPLRSLTSGQVLVIGAAPIKEPVAAYGTFIMNRFPELQQAISDYETGKMGTLTI
jgi:redox-sensitive bicupin YhaK (pirin superfamily)